MTYLLCLVAITYLLYLNKLHACKFSQIMILDLKKLDYEKIHTLQKGITKKEKKIFCFISTNECS